MAGSGDRLFRGKGGANFPSGPKDGPNAKVAASGGRPRGCLVRGQQGGFRESGLIEAAREILRLPGVRIAGVTGFPCLLYDQDRGDVQPLANAHTVLRCAERLSEELGISLEQINVPSATCVSTIPILKELGATHGEPGHALTGTTPPAPAGGSARIAGHGVCQRSLPPGWGDRAYVYGGGFYRRSRARDAIVGKTFRDDGLPGPGAGDAAAVHRLLRGA